MKGTSGSSSETSENDTLLAGSAPGHRRQLPRRVFVRTGALVLGLAISALLWSQRPLGAAGLRSAGTAILQLCGSYGSTPQHTEAPKHPHVVVVVLDDVGYGDIKPWAGNNTIIKTPNIDRLANEGMILDRHYSQVRCTPSRAAFLTGRYPIRYGLQAKVLQPIKPYGLPVNESTMAQILKKAGYATHHVGKWHLGFHTWEVTPTFRGFDTWFGISEGESDHFDYTVDIGKKAKDINVLFWQREPNCGDGCIVKEERHEYSSTLWTEQSVRIVEEHNLSVPLFLYLCYTGPHAPCETPSAPYSDLYPDVKDPKRRVYAEMLSATDGGIGNVTAALAKRGMLNDTILVVFSDNGGPVGFPGQTSKGAAEHCEPFGKWGADTGASNYPFRGGKGATFEGGVRTPAFIHYPRQIKAGTHFAGLAHVTDWLPTILAAASVDDTGDRTAMPLDGVNLWSALRANGSSPRLDLLTDIDANGVDTGGALIRGWKKLFVGKLFNSTNFWALPPEVAAVQNLSAEDDPIFAPAMYCEQGCIFDLKADPYEKHPRNATADDKDLMDAYMKYHEVVAPSLFIVTRPNKTAVKVYLRQQSTWPYVSTPEASHTA